MWDANTDFLLIGDCKLGKISQQLMPRGRWPNAAIDQRDKTDTAMDAPRSGVREFNIRFDTSLNELDLCGRIGGGATVGVNAVAVNSG